ncbi:MAG: UDP-N-acetylmuramoyl-L-alanine--D-glutamate ligase [Flavobacteriales bacterium]|nr:UDP-N-acetylmuramoyl-L-alanine--D-glutamate ligase [Flavobacteriales bacterium]
MNLSDPILALGAGESGVGSALLAKSLGARAFVSDAGEGKGPGVAELQAAGIDYEVDGHRFDEWPEVGTVVKSPGIPESAAVVKECRERGWEVISDIEYAARAHRALGHANPVVAVTGANGKTTTTSMIDHMLRHEGWDVDCVGNIGTSWSRRLAERISRDEGEAQATVIEVSSFQLDGTNTFRPDVAVLLNITPDHLDRYGYEMANYAASKWRITASQTQADHLIYNADCEWTQRMLDQHGTSAQLLPLSAERSLHEVMRDGRGGGLDSNDNSQFILQHFNSFSMTIQKLAMQGKHNLFNSMAAGMTGRILDLRKEGIRESLQSFEGVEHRLEFVQEVNGITFINDSKATNVNSVWYALECATTPVIWIAGGIDKGNDYSTLVPLVRDKVKHMICLGKNNAPLHAAFDELVESSWDVGSAEEAVAKAYELGQPGETALLAPACASFDLFGSYEQRGRAFKAAVRRL